MTDQQQSKQPIENAQHAVTQPLQFYSAWYCPFAQRAWMALLYKGLDFEYLEVDPYRESTWWLRISRNQRWYDNMCHTPILKDSLTEPEHYRQRVIEHYLPFSQGEGQKDITAVD